MSRLAVLFTLPLGFLFLSGCIDAGEPAESLQAGLQTDATHRAVLVGESDPDFPLGLPRDVVIDADGWIHVSDFLFPTVAVMGPTGEIRSTWGVRGEGPGEFREITSMSPGPDGSIVVYDRGLSRITKVAPPTGEVVEVVRFRHAERAIDLRPIGPSRWLAWHRAPVWADVEDPDPTDHIRLLDESGKVLVGELLTFPSQAMLTVRDAGAMLAVTDPFGFRPFVAATPSGDILLARSDSVGFTRYRIGSGQNEAQVRVRAMVEPEAATSDEIEEMFLADGGFSSLPAVLRQRIRGSAAAVPPLTGLLVDGDGHVWMGVRARGVPSGRWLKVSIEGDFILSIDIDRNERVAAHVADLLVTVPIPSPEAWPVVRFYRIEGGNP